MLLALQGSVQAQGLAQHVQVHPREREYNAENRAYFFGSFGLLRHAQPIGEPLWRRHKAKALLKWFLLNPARPYSADQLIDLFWPDSPAEAALRSLYVTIHHLRRLLEPDLLPHQESRYLRRDKNNFYWLELDESWWADIYDLHHLSTTARRLDRDGQRSRASFYYRKIVSYCSKGFLPEDRDAPMFAAHRQQYDCLYLQVLERLIHICSEQNELEEALEYSYLALLLEHYSETAIQAIVKVYCQQSDETLYTDQKLAAFRTFLRKELGVETTDEWVPKLVKLSP